MRRFTAILALGIALNGSAVHAEYTEEDTYAALEQYAEEFGVSYGYLRSIIRCETGGTYNPYSRGRQGELGVAQLHPRGELLTFYRWGYDDAFSPYQSVRFLAQRILQGGARYWACA